MNNNNSVYEVTQMLGDTKTIQNDLTLAMNNVTKIFTDKYVKKLQDTVLTHKKDVSENMPKEVGLLHALKPFFNENNHAKIDKMVDVVILLNTAKSMNDDINQIYTQQIQNNKPVYSMSNSSVHSDGIYDIDEKCMLQKKLPQSQEVTYSMTHMLLFLTLMNHMK